MQIFGLIGLLLTVAIGIWLVTVTLSPSAESPTEPQEAPVVGGSSSGGRSSYGETLNAARDAADALRPTTNVE